MTRSTMKIFASAFGSLALIAAVGCEKSAETRPEDTMATPAPGQEVNSLRPTPNQAPSNNTGAVAQPDTERMPVSGTEVQPQGAGGAGGHGGHGGHAGHAGEGHGGKAPH